MASFHPLLEPYQPTPSDPFDAAKAAHLLNRAGFGGTKEEIAHIQSLGPEAAADEMLDFPDAPAEEQSETDVPDLSGIDGVPTSFRELYRTLQNKSEDDKRELRAKFNQANNQVMMATTAWWLKRMADGPYPMQEKLALFWHGHFTSSFRDERAALLMWNQNELERTNAAGNFGKFAHAISRDPAMLDYLNNTQNKKEHPNENYAREVMELFTLGIGNYTENDVKQGARAFTGWSHDGENYFFRPFEHDYGVKTFLGRVGNFNGDDVINIILQQPVCANYISSKLYKYFVHPDVDPQLAEAMGSLLRENDYELRPLLRTMLSSKAFYSSQAIGAQIKSPIQLMVGTVRLLGLEMPPLRAIDGMLTQMGQTPFAPPNVRGWVGGRTWINTSTLFVRYNAGVWLAGGSVPEFGPAGLRKKEGNAADGQRLQRMAQSFFNPEKDETLRDASADQIADAWVSRLIQRPVNSTQRQVLIQALGDDPSRPQTVRNMVQLILSTPEYQLC